jgi:uncharacterized membrane protein
MTAFYILIGILLALACIVTPFLNIFAMPIMGYVLGGWIGAFVGFVLACGISYLMVCEETYGGF